MDKFDEQAIEFLAVKENLKSGMQVERLMPFVRQHLKRRFWLRVADGVAQHLNEEKIHDWTIRHDEGTAYDNGSTIQIRPLTGQYYPAIGIYGSKLYYGIVRDSDEPHPDLSDFRQLREALKGHGDKAHFGEDEYWLAWWDTDTQVDNDYFLVQTADVDSRFTDEHVDLLWDLFRESREYLGQINGQLPSTP